MIGVWLKIDSFDWRVRGAWLKGDRVDWRVTGVWLKGDRGLTEGWQGFDWRVTGVWLKGDRGVTEGGQGFDWRVMGVWLKGDRCLTEAGKSSKLGWRQWLGLGIGVASGGFPTRLLYIIKFLQSMNRVVSQQELYWLSNSLCETVLPTFMIKIINKQCRICPGRSQNHLVKTYNHNSMSYSYLHIDCPC